MKLRRFSLFALIVCQAPFFSHAQQQTSENEDRIRLLFRQFPEADTDKDGVLTRDEAVAFLQKRRGGGRQPNTTIFQPSDEELAAAVALGEKMSKGPFHFEKGNGLRVLITGHSWVAPGKKTLPGIAAAGGFDGHRQRDHSGGGATGAANAIWLKEFGKWKDDFPQRSVIIPAIVTGKWDVMTWGSYYDDKPEFYSQWIDLGLKHNPEMRFLIQDGWPRFSPQWKDLSPEEISKKVSEVQKEIQGQLYQINYDALEEKYPGKVRIIPASYAVVDLIQQFCNGKVTDFDCIDERSQSGKRGVYRDGGHLSRDSGIEQLCGYLYYGMLYEKSPLLIEGYEPANIPPALDKAMREAAWKAIVGSPFAGVDDADGDGTAD